MSKKALITGITGQDGSYLTELLLEHGYTVHGIVRRSSSTIRARIDHLTCDPSVYNDRLFLHYADLDDATTLRRLLISLEPNEIYHLAGQSHVGLSFEIPESTCEFTAMGTLRLLETIRDLKCKPKILHASSSEIFGNPAEHPQTELTPFRPTNPYGIAKCFATDMVRVYRERFGIFGCNAICYNHESPRRGQSFVTSKIAKAAASIKLGLQKDLVLGDLDSMRDWGWAPDYVRGMWQMLQSDTPDDFVLATGKLHSVRDFLDIAFARVGLDWNDYVKQDPKFIRMENNRRLLGCSSKAFDKFGWKSTKDFQDIVNAIVDSFLADLSTDGLTQKVQQHV